MGVGKAERRSKGGHHESGQRGTKKQGWSRQRGSGQGRAKIQGVDNARVSDVEK